MDLRQCLARFQVQSTNFGNLHFLQTRGWKLGKRIAWLLQTRAVLVVHIQGFQHLQ